ncbi:MAG TPA: aldo/keto reductase [Candidatus Mcinerneyibacteriales bacterium]|nr:aldo/keto reductase [Candidatus Mcinerneyibacteriales bacterium]HPJ69498.1 aldo/keto reductase [Candidatus Mcinerneyibacteriales bacterium]
MKYRTMPSTGDKISVLGFGCMRFPKREDGSIDEEKSEAMLTEAVRKGVNYIDTAWPYHEGKSEPFVGKVLHDNKLRDKVFLATKLPTFLIKKEEDFEDYFQQQLERLQTDHIDYYLVHTLNRRLWKNATEKGLFAFLDRIKADGRARHIGFSFHDHIDVFKEIVDAYPWEFCQIQYNYLDIDYQAGREGLLYARSKGLGVIVMEPLRGGSLVHKLPSDVKAAWDKSSVKRSPVEWALKWVWNHPEVDLLLSGMSEPEHVTENIRLAGEAESGELTESELKLADEARSRFLEKLKVNCTACGYCLPCPHGVAIPSVFGIYNDASLFEDMEGGRERYLNWIKEENRASRCVECGACEKACPQQIPVIQKLKDVVSVFEN